MQGSKPAAGFGNLCLMAKGKVIRCLSMTWLMLTKHKCLDPYQLNPDSSHLTEPRHAPESSAKPMYVYEGLLGLPRRSGTPDCLELIVYGI